MLSKFLLLFKASISSTLPTSLSVNLHRRLSSFLFSMPIMIIGTAIRTVAKGIMMAIACSPGDSPLPDADPGTSTWPPVRSINQRTNSHVAHLRLFVLSKFMVTMFKTEAYGYGCRHSLTKPLVSVLWQVVLLFIKQNRYLIYYIRYLI